MRTARLSEVKNELSRYIEQVRHGERVRITVRGIAVADLVPVEARRKESGDWPELRQLERHGLVRFARRSVDDSLLERPGPKVRGADAVSAILEDRRR